MSVNITIEHTKTECTLSLSKQTVPRVILSHVCASEDRVPSVWDEKKEGNVRNFDCLTLPRIK